MATACNPPLPPPAEPASQPAAESFPEDFYRDARARGEPIYSVDGAASRLVLRVYRDGELARLGHDHVVSSTALRGYALMDPANGQLRADIELPLQSLVVDDENLRREAGLPVELTSAQVEATRRNMLERVLDAAHFPLLYAHAECEPSVLPCSELRTRLSLHGRRHEQTVQLRRPIGSGEELEASGCFSARQSDYGIVPLSVLNGALSVKDELQACFDIRLRRALR